MLNILNNYNKKTRQNKMETTKEDQPKNADAGEEIEEKKGQTDEER